MNKKKRVRKKPDEIKLIRKLLALKPKRTVLKETCGGCYWGIKTGSDKIICFWGKCMKGGVNDG